MVLFYSRHFTLHFWQPPMKKVICRYIESAYPEPALYPTELADKAMADWYEELGSGYISELAAAIFFQRFMRPFASKQEPDTQLRHDPPSWRHCRGEPGLVPRSAT